MQPKGKSHPGLESQAIHRLFMLVKPSYPSIHASQAIYPSIHAVLTPLIVGNLVTYVTNVTQRAKQ